jgi:hypothetical protein
MASVEDFLEFKQITQNFAPAVNEAPAALPLSEE